MIAYRKIDETALEGIKALYAQSGWLAYLQDDAALTRALGCSIYLLGAFEGEELVGFARCVGDGEHIVLLQDLIVEKAHRGKGIGTALFKKVQSHYAQVRTCMLLTDSGDAPANAFYRKQGYVPLDDRDIIGYMRG